jgi:murein DD-endopeptidase MepM/ murein hydrolase activator NlpD
MKTTNRLSAMVLAGLQRISHWRPHFTRTRVGLFGLTLVIVGISLGGLETTTHSEAHAYSRTLELELPSRDPVEDLLPETQTELHALLTPPPAASADGLWQEVTVRSGQTLDSIFRQQGYSIPLLHEIVELDSDTKTMVRIRPGDVFGFQNASDGSLSRLRFPIDESAYLVVENTPEGLRSERLPRQVFATMSEAEGQIDSSLFLAGKQAGLSDNMIMKLANVFGWDIDFVLDIRKGDKFFVIYEKIYRDGEFLRDGELLAATFINQGQRFQAFRHEVDGKGEYYAPDGGPMRKAFLRAPLDFARITSNFNPKRFHPVLKRVKPHNGIDYGAPTGTPVYAAGDGRVVRSDYNKFNGHHVYIQHAGSIETRYLHFTKRAVSNGQRVRQGQVIGYVGSTGMSTAPHLHYEFLVHGVHRNPRTVDLPEAERLEGAELGAFLAAAAPIQNQLSRLESASLYAIAE